MCPQKPLTYQRKQKGEGEKKAVEEQADGQIVRHSERDIALISYHGFIFKIIAVMTLN